MTKMIEQLIELLNMQKALDEAIMKEKGIEKYPVENMKIALFVELGEMMNEFPTHFKHWKSSAVDNREKGLVEYVDALHFALSLTNHFYHNLTEIVFEDWDYEFNNLGYEVDKKELSYLLCECPEQYRTSYCLRNLLLIGKYFGFTWEEIYSAYISKNKVNYERLKNNY